MNMMKREGKYSFHVEHFLKRISSEAYASTLLFQSIKYLWTLLLLVEKSLLWVRLQLGHGEVYRDVVTCYGLSERFGMIYILNVNPTPSNFHIWLIYGQ